MKKQIVLAFTIVLSYFALSSAIDGTATYFTAQITPSSCYGYEDMGTLIAAASNVIWHNRTTCGQNYRVTCTGPTTLDGPIPCTGASVVVKIVDYCPPGCRGTFDLSQQAFSTIADLNADKIKIDYVQV